ncbi:two pore segment channel 3 isoform X2 [Brienomyrus brachyistius]|uniref:two pore segment channel 3 isoform X2 n=1 Tax=Brienomyrus brachyistius TaxID=42636 RepID=UPI0020B237D6|nr:two pore segment channel 3 isoform X2 [Brienomyrus brachyistius]
MLLTGEPRRTGRMAKPETPVIFLHPVLRCPVKQIELAAVYVSDAQYNRNICFNISPQGIRLYKFYIHSCMRIIILFFIFVDLALAIFEEPAIFPFPLWANFVIEVTCLVAFTARLVHYAKVIPRSNFWKDPKNICIIVVIFLTLVDMIIYGILTEMHLYCVRWSRVLRPLLLVNITESRQLRRAFRSIRNALPHVLYVFFLFMFSVLMFSLMALKLFGKRGLVTSEGSAYFTDYLDIVFDLYVLVTTANSPDVMMPAYNYGIMFAVFFIICIVINTYIFMSVFLAVVYNNYKKHLKEEVRQLVRAKRRNMVQAFQLLQEPCSDEPVVMRETWNRLVHAVQPGISAVHRELLWNVSDEHNRGYIGRLAFIQLADLLNIQVITLKSRIHFLQIYLPGIYNSAASRCIRCVVQHRFFVYVYDLIILVNAVFIGLDEEKPFISYSEWVFLGLYLLEILLKLYAFEPRAFYARHQFWNWFDTIIVICALFATILNSALKSSSNYNSREILDIIFILRVLRLIRVVDSIKRFRTVINTLIKIGPTILTFGQLIIVIYYIFAMVGMELFKGKIQFFENGALKPGHEFCGNPLLNGSAFAKNNYCRNNFNNVISSFILLFELTVVNQWHVLASGFTTVTSNAARIYFVVFHIVVVIIIINIFVAFVLEAFFVEYNVSTSGLQTSLEKKIKELELGIDQDQLEGNLIENLETNDNDLGPSGEHKGKPSVMFTIASKRYRTVEALLQRMFEADLSPEDDADDEDHDNSLSPELSFPNPAFNTT